MDLDFKKIKQLYQLTGSLGWQDIQVLLKTARFRTFEVQDYLLREGSLDSTIYFIRKGLLRTFVIDARGEEITTALLWENQIYANYDAILFEQPARSFVQALEKTEVICLDFEKAQVILNQNPKLEANRKYIFRNILKRSIIRSESFVLLTPEERYLDFVKQNPDIVNRVPGKYIANVLGVTPVSLSRIRRRIAARKSQLA